MTTEERKKSALEALELLCKAIFCYFDSPSPKEIQIATNEIENFIKGKK